MKIVQEKIYAIDSGNDIITQKAVCYLISPTTHFNYKRDLEFLIITIIHIPVYCG